MTWDEMANDWTESQSKVRQRWSKLTDEDLRRIQGRRAELAQLIAQRYGVEQDQAESEIEDFEQSDAFEENDEMATMDDRSSMSSQDGKSSAAGESGKKTRSGPGSDASRETTGKSADDEDEALNQPRRGAQETGRSGGMRSEP